MPATTHTTSADEVDLIVAAWRRERPDLDVAPLEVLSRISRISQLLDDARQQVFADHGLDGWGFDVLSALRRVGEPYELSPGELVQQTHVTSGTMTNRIDRLAARSLVERRPSPNDRRGVLIRLTPSGHDLVDAAITGLIAREHLLIDELTASQQSRLASLLRLVLGQIHRDPMPAAR